MSKLTSRGFSQADADEFMARSSGSHTQRWTAQVFRWTSSGAEAVMLDPVPITGGTLTLDSGDPNRRQLTLEVGGGDDLVPRTADDPLVPFGQIVRLKSTVDRADGTWLPWLSHGIFPIQSNAFERPSLIQTVECSDLSARVNEFLHLNKKTYTHTTLSKAVIAMVQDALPDALVADQSQIAAGAKTYAVNGYPAESGSGRWDTAVELCTKRGYTPFFDSLGRVVIRPSLTGTDDDISGAGGDAPDIGTVADPVATISDGKGGTLVGMTATTSRQSAANLVRINMHETAKGQHEVIHIEAVKTNGAVMYGDIFGRIPLVQDVNVARATAANKSTYATRAGNLLMRRLGLARFLDFDMIGGTWLEPDDKVTLEFDGRTESHYVSAVTFDLAGQAATRVRTRALSVLDPGA